MANYYVSSVAYLAIAQFAISTPYTLGQYVRQLATPAVGSERVFKVTTAGTSGGAEPTWNLTNNATTVSGTVTFTQVAGQEAEQLAGNWRAAAFSTNAINTLFTLQPSDNVFVSSDHDESRAAALALNGSPANFLSVSRVGASLPPVEADYARGAKIQTTGANSLTFNTTASWKGFDYFAGSAANNASIIFAGAVHFFEDCEFQLNHTNTSGRFAFGNGTTSRGYREFNNCGFTFGANGQGFSNDFSEVLLKNRPTNFLKGTVTTNDIFNFLATNGSRCKIRCEGVDLSPVTTRLTNSSQFFEFEAINCKLASGLTLPTSLGAQQEGSSFRLHGSDGGTIRNWFFYEVSRGGLIQATNKGWADDGATDGVTSYSVECITNSPIQSMAENFPIPRINRS